MTTGKAHVNSSQIRWGIHFLRTWLGSPKNYITYITHFLQQNLTGEGNETKGDPLGKSTFNHLLYTSSTLPFLCPSFNTWAIILSPHILFTGSHCPTNLSSLPESLPRIVLPSLPVLFLWGGEYNLISHCWMGRPFLSGSRWWKMRLFGLSSFHIHRVLLSAHGHQITMNLGSLAPLI